MKEKKHYFKVGLQIFLLVMFSFAFSYALNENTKSPKTLTQDKEDGKIKLALLALAYLGRLMFSDKNLVSAQELSGDLGLFTCVKGNEGFCVIYTSASECENACEDSCIPSTDVSECKLGTCYDSVEGVCQANAPKIACERGEGEWYDDSQINMGQCQLGCCILGSNAFFVTDQRCSALSGITGLEKDYRPETKSEAECIAFAKDPTGEGACVFESENQVRNCVRTTEGECSNVKGDFYSGFLCTALDLNTTCQRKTGRDFKTSCVSERDGVYFVDSCGNIANIYDANKKNDDDYWTRIIPKTQSCSLGTPTSPLANKEICGNCDVVEGSICSEGEGGAVLGDNICKDLSCGEVDGEERSHLDSWCRYQGKIGVERGEISPEQETGFDKWGKGFGIESLISGERSRDIPGSRHFRRTCQYGEVVTDACDGARGYICVESREQVGGEQLSAAACRPNGGLACISYNSGDEAAKASQCSENPDCHLKLVYVSDVWFFNVCVPKYPPGFDLRNPKLAQSAAGVCAIASKKCTYLEEKTADGWVCVENCECLTAFPLVMHDLCMSLGDCGVSVNQIGKYRENYRLGGDITGDTLNFFEIYKQALKNYHHPVQGEYIDAAEGMEQVFIPGVGVINAVEMDEEFSSKTATTIGITALFLRGTGKSKLATAGASGFWSAIWGGTIGYAVTTLLISWLDAPGLDEGFVTSLQVAGTVGGGMIALGATGAEGSGLATVGTIGLVIAIVVVTIIVILAIFDIGEQRTRSVYFNCLPWKPQKGGEDCERCGEDGLGCSKYSCHSLGEVCGLVNEGTTDEKCADVGVAEILPPRIKPWTEALDDGYSYEEKETLGFKIKGPEECIQEYDSFSFGITLDEFGQCRFDLEDKEFGSMSNYFSSGLFDYNHSHLMSVPSLESLGVSAEAGPGITADARFYINCEDVKGNNREAGYVVEFCVKAGDISRAPLVKRREPTTEFTKYDAVSQKGSVFTDIPSECRWSTADKDYGLMENKMTCLNSFPDDLTVFGYKCSTEEENPFPITGNENKFYIRCKSRPWETDESKRAANQESYEFVLKKSGMLNVDYVLPNETIRKGVRPASVDIEAGTSGGINGNAECSYVLKTDYLPNVSDVFFDTWDVTHTQTLTLLEGRHVINVTCEDRAGNTAEKIAAFVLELDEDPPIVTRAYNKADELIVLTNEFSECSYSLTSCNFDFENGTTMSGTEFEHATVFENNIYHVKCKDEFGHVPGDCSIVVRKG